MSRSFTKLSVMLGLLLVAALGVWRLSKHHSESPKPMTEYERQAELATKDRAALENPKASEPEVYGALVRRGQKLDPIAKQEAIARSGSSSRLIREGAANALGYFTDPESLATLHKLLADKDVNVRVQALNGVAHQRGPEREKMLREFLARGDLAPEERVAAQSALILVGGSTQDKNKAIGELLQLAKSEKNPVLKERALMQAVSLAPRDPRVLDAMRDQLREGNDANLRSIAIRHLSAAQDEWMRGGMRKFQDDKDPQVRLAVVQSLHMACPIDRWSILEHVIRTDRNRLVLDTAIQEVRAMPGQDAVALLERLKASAKDLQPNEVMAIEKELSDLKGSNSVDPCLALRK